MEIWIYPPTENKLGYFASNGCHATALLNAINTVAGATATPRNVRDYAEGIKGTRDAGGPDTEDRLLTEAEALANEAMR